MDLHEHKKHIHKKKVRQRSGFSLIIVPHYQGKIKRIVITPLRLYTSLLIVSLFFVAIFSFAFQYKDMTKEVAELKGMKLGSMASSQTKELQIVSTELAKAKSDLEALKQYVVYLSSLENEVRDSLKLGESKLSLEYVLNRSTKNVKIQSFSTLPVQVAQLLTEQTNTAKLAEEREQTLNKLKDAADEFNLMKAQTPDAWPLYGTITSYFGWRISPFGGGWEFHDGLDIASYYGAPIRAAGEGEVVYVGWESGYGRMVKIYHRDGIETIYGHMSDYAVKVGDKVKKGQVVGYVGCSGLCTGPHVHFQIEQSGTAVNPLKFLE